MVENSKAPAQTNEVLDSDKNIGLKNVRRRLELFFPDKHELKILEEPDSFLVKLEIDLSGILVPKSGVMQMARNIKCIIVDDEPLARSVLVDHADQIDQLEVVAVCANAVEAFGHLQKEEIDLVFLDIKMPKISGLELLESLDHQPLVAFTTAYREFAI